MKFYFCEKYINTEANDKEVKRDMYAALPCFQDSDNQYGYEKWENNFKVFSYFVLTSSEQKCHYVQMKLVGKAYCWEKGSHIDYRCWFVLKSLLCTLYAPHFLYSFKVDYKEPEIVERARSC